MRVDQSLQCGQSKVCGPLITMWTVKYVWTSNCSVDNQVYVDQSLQCGQSSMCGPVITVWTVKYVWTINNNVDSQVCVDH